MSILQKRLGDSKILIKGDDKLRGLANDSVKKSFGNFDRVM